MGYHTIGSLVHNIHGYDDLKRIRNCGKKSIDEILEKLFCYQYSLIAPEKKAVYISRLKKLNDR
jgi:DNA-directed RNA polymerase alpha subunit